MKKIGYKKLMHDRNSLQKIFYSISQKCNNNIFLFQKIEK